jgi:hypothetical protein
MSEPTHDTRALVDRLITDVAPVRRVWRPGVRLAVWLAVVVAIGWWRARAGLRPDLALQLGTLRYGAELLIIGAAALLAGNVSLRLAVPGTDAGGSRLVALAGLVAAALLLSLRQPARVDLPLADFIAIGTGCAIATITLALAPWVVLLVVLRRGAPLDPGPAGAAAGGAAFLAAFAVMRLVCPLDERLHLLVWHGLPVALGVALSAFLGLAWLRRWRTVGR